MRIFSEEGNQKNQACDQKEDASKHGPKSADARDDETDR
jgi:hypothetical protein